MAEPVNELVRLAEADGATFVRIPTGSWLVRDRDGCIIARGCLSQAEAAAHYCEDRDLTASTPEGILARIRFEWRPYDTMKEFDEGFADYQANRRHERYEGVRAQAYDRGANAAMLYARALAFLDKPEEKPVPALGWLARLLRTGRA